MSKIIKDILGLQFKNTN